MQPGVTPTTENDVYERVMEAIAGQDGLIVADFDAMDTERLLTFNHVAEATGRKLVLTPRDVHMYLAMSTVWRQFPAFDEVATFRMLDAPQLDESNYGREAELREQFQAILISPEELRENSGDYIVRSSPPELSVLEAEKPAPGRLHSLARSHRERGRSSDTSPRHGTQHCWSGRRRRQLFPLVSARDV